MRAAALDKTHELEKLQRWGLQKLGAEALQLPPATVTNVALLG